jgi:FtsP/CotA-like multicopper oxidase with cupredoxin domain
MIGQSMTTTHNLSVPAIGRRTFTLLGGAAALSSIAPRPTLAGPAVPDATRLHVGPARVPLAGAGHPDTLMWTYDGTVSGPVRRVRQGVPFQAVVENGLAEGTTVHWHGMRLPNAMDGVPGLTQAPIRPGGQFTYAFTPQDAGTFWYHPHANGLEQIGRGLAGVLIVEEAEPPPFDRELVWPLSDWQLTEDAQIAPGFGNRMSAMMAGRIGNVVTIDGRIPESVSVRAGERVRLRLANMSVARTMALRFEGHRPVVVAYDGQPCDPHEPADGRILLGAAMRADVVLDMQGDPGQRYRVTDDFYGDRMTYTLVELDYDAGAPVRTHPSDTPMRLPRNPLPEPDLATAERHEMALQGGGMSGMGQGLGMGRGALWAINGASMTGDGPDGMSPMLTLTRGRTTRLVFRNETTWWHPMHLHGHSFKVLARNGAPVPHQVWGDTVLVAPHEVVEVAFVADNPGDWMLHCHVMDHQTAGLMTVLRVA